MDQVSLIREIKELKTQLAYQKNLGFFFGAGTSCALKVPNISDLTAQVERALTEDSAKLCKIIHDDLESDDAAKKSTIEDILNQVRQIRSITRETDRTYQSVSGKAAKSLDKEICNKIYEIIAHAESEADLTVPRKFVAWLNLLSRESTKEIFTTNYDLIIEKSLELCQIPYFDGFVGSYEPFFWNESVEKAIGVSDLTRNWIRLWKIHGSLGWFWKSDSTAKAERIVRTGRVADISSLENEVVIYPSRDKYDSSRKQPFLAYFDRLKSYLLSGELLFLFSGYSFSDQHINEIVFKCLRQNRRLSVLVFSFSDSDVDKLTADASDYLNLSVFGPTKVIINGSVGTWSVQPEELDQIGDDSFWNKDANFLTLGNFLNLVEFLIQSTGKQDLVDLLVK